DRREYGLANGFRIGFYRVGMLFAGAVLMLSGWFGWPQAYLLGGAVFACNAVMALCAPREAARGARGGSVATEFALLRAQPLWIVALGLVLVGLLWPAAGPLVQAFGWDAGWRMLGPVSTTWW